MARTLTASERSSLIRFASTLNSGDPLKRAIIGGLQQKVAKRDEWIKRWYGSLGPDGESVDFYCEFMSNDLSPRDPNFGAAEKREFDRVLALIKNTTPKPKVDYYDHSVETAPYGVYSNRIMASVSWPGLRDPRNEAGERIYLSSKPGKILEAHGYSYDRARGN